jgi:hypothetical protein
MSGDTPQITAQSNAVCPLQSLEFTMLSSAGNFFPPGARSISNPCAAGEPSKEISQVYTAVSTKRDELDTV